MADTLPYPISCEAGVYGRPEWMSMFTSLFVTLFNGLALFNAGGSSLLMRVAYSLLFVNGFTSFIYHTIPSWETLLIDTYPQVGAIAITSYISADIVLYKLIQRHPTLYRIGSNILVLIYAAYYTVILGVQGGDNSIAVLSISYMAPLTILLASLLTIRYHTHRIYFYRDDVKYLYQLAGYGALSIFIGVVLWHGGRELCKVYSWIGWFFLHALWHIFVSLGGLLGMQFFVMVRGVDRGIDGLSIRWKFLIADNNTNA